MHAEPVIHRHAVLAISSLGSLNAAYRTAIRYVGTQDGRPIEVVVWTRRDGVRDYNCCFLDDDGVQTPRSATYDVIEAIRRYGFRDEGAEAEGTPGG